MCGAIECQDDTVLLCRRDACKYVDLLDYLGERCIGHMIQVAAQNDSAAIQPDLFAYMACDQLVVARQDLDLHAIALEGLQYLGRVRLRRIGKGQEAKQDQRLWVRLRVGSLLGYRAIGYSENTVARCTGYRCCQSSGSIRDV